MAKYVKCSNCVKQSNNRCLPTDLFIEDDKRVHDCVNYMAKQWYKHKFYARCFKNTYELVTLISTRTFIELVNDKDIAFDCIKENVNCSINEPLDYNCSMNRRSSND